jgi:hypothetical protein
MTIEEARENLKKADAKFRQRLYFKTEYWKAVECYIRKEVKSYGTTRN